MPFDKIDATSLWPRRFTRSPRPQDKIIRSESPHTLLSSSSDEQTSSICETPISNRRVPRRGYDSEPFNYSRRFGYQTSRSDASAQKTAPPPKVVRVNMGLSGAIPVLNLSSTNADSIASKERLLQTEALPRKGDMSGDFSCSSSMVHDTPMPRKTEPQYRNSPSHWIISEQGRLAKLLAIEKLKAVTKLIGYRTTVGAAFSILKNNIHLARDMDTRERLDSIIEQRQAEMVEWESEMERLKADNELKCQQILSQHARERAELLAEKDQKIAELEIRLKVYEDDLKHEQAERQNLTRNNQRERLIEIAELSRKMKARVLTVRRKFRLLNYCMSSWYHARLKIWQRNELGRVHRELQTAKHECSMATREANTCRKELLDVKQESEEIKDAVWSVWTNQVSYNDRRLKKLMRGLSRLVDGIGPDMQHGSKSFFETLMRHYRNSGAGTLRMQSDVHSAGGGIRPPTIAVV